MGVYAPPALVSPPAIQALPFDLLSVATVIDMPGDSHELNGITYKSLACGADLNQFVALCPPSTNPVKTATDADRLVIISDDLIELYANLSCKETTLEAMFQEARDIFALGENRAFGSAFWSTMLAVGTTVILNTDPGAGGALSVTAAVAALESAMSCCYPGRPVFHSDRGVVAYATEARQLHVSGNELLTALNSPWAAYACPPETGPDGIAAPAGYAWVYATSQPVIRRWPTATRPTDVGHILTRDAATGAITNEPSVKVERSYLPSLECCAFAVLVCLPASCS